MRTASEVSGAGSELTVVPLELFGEYTFKAPGRKIVPYAGVGAVAFYSIQDGSNGAGETSTQTEPALTAGFEWQTPWNWTLHTRFREAQTLKANTHSWSGQIYDVGIAYQL
jgi:outer membrane protein W